MVPAIYQTQTCDVEIHTELTRAQFYQLQISENFRFLEMKILFVVETTPIEEKKLKKFRSQFYQNTTKTSMFSNQFLYFSFFTNNVASITNKIFGFENRNFFGIRRW